MQPPVVPTAAAAVDVIRVVWKPLLVTASVPGQLPLTMHVLQPVGCKTARPVRCPTRVSDKFID